MLLLSSASVCKSNAPNSGKLVSVLPRREQVALKHHVRGKWHKKLKQFSSQPSLFVTEKRRKGRSLVLPTKPLHRAQQQVTNAPSNSPGKLLEHAALQTGFKARLVQLRLQQLGQGSTKEYINIVLYNLQFKLPGTNYCYTQKLPNMNFQGG